MITHTNSINVVYEGEIKSRQQTLHIVSVNVTLQTEPVYKLYGRLDFAVSAAVSHNSLHSLRRRFPSHVKKSCLYYMYINFEGVICCFLWGTRIQYFRRAVRSIFSPVFGDRSWSFKGFKVHQRQFWCELLSLWHSNMAKKMRTSTLFPRNRELPLL